MPGARVYLAVLPEFGDGTRRGVAAPFGQNMVEEPVEHGVDGGVCTLILMSSLACATATVVWITSCPMVT